MKECDNSKIHISSNFIFSICLIILDTFLLRLVWKTAVFSGVYRNIIHRWQVVGALKKVAHYASLPHARDGLP